MTKIYVTRPLPEAVEARLKGMGDCTFRPSTAPLDGDELRASLRDHDLVLPTLRDMYSAEVFADVPSPRARLLANFGVGYNHIDVAAATAAGVAVSNTPGAVTDATADIGLTLMLMSCRRAAEGERLVRAGDWEGWHPVQMLGLHMTGKTLGVIGMGRIGKAVARRAALGFGMKVVFHNRSRVADPGVEAVQLDTLHEVMAAADVVIVCVPGGPATRHLVDAAAIAAMQPHAHLVNIARGDIVDESALIAALEAGRIGGAGLDVYEDEPAVPEGLRALPNVTLLPHLGTATLEVREAMGHMAADNLEAVLNGAPPPNAVSPD
ncbi:2-hydroxyacid dehydrogenase [Mangrovicoccus algicola]|uniref:D-glycerate dehydrogenase n=1 Tax=Mangrovicoccus algicola TaxID=2771008 RepID=A0A8J6YW30_9RHOB|nr:D-glycerate dehydrogenase [Mangrovicoccus algicola]MBE3638692.1 D-glycerate dehydrogenase [Mangrovicoccus algicola]